jgi:hypothetical protein
MGLQPRKLFNPYSVSGGFVEEKEGKKNTAYVLNEYCKLHLQSPDSIWKSHVINTIICPDLHTDIILGLDFLSKNKIVVDTELHTVVAKESGYDSLNPGIPHAHITPLTPLQQQKKIASEIKLAHHEIRTTQRKVHKQLLELVKENLDCFNFEAYTSTPINVIGLIKTRIEQLAGLLPQ